MLPPLFLCILSTTLNATFAAFSKTGPRCHNSSSPVNYRGLLPFPDGFLAIVPELFAIESWNFAWLTLLSSPTLWLSSGQVRSLTYDVISLTYDVKVPRTVTKCRNFATLRMTGNLSQEDKTSRNRDPRILTFWMSRIFNASSEVRLVTWTRPVILWGILKLLFCGVNDTIWTQTHLTLLSYTTVVSPYLIFYCWFCVTSHVRSQGFV